MGKKQFPIPILTEKTWKELQENLKTIYTSATAAEYTLCPTSISLDNLSGDQKIILGCLEKIQISLGLIDHILGREYSLDEVIEELKAKHKQFKYSIKEERGENE